MSVAGVEEEIQPLVCAVTVHLLLFLFECHGNNSTCARLSVYVRAYVPVRVI